MNPERWQQIKEILDTVAASPSGHKRGVAREACGGDPGLLSDVESFLEFDDEIDDFIEEPLWSITGSGAAGGNGDDSVSSESRRVGPYRLDKLLGRGGMGAVYLAHREDEYEQQVALKLVNWGMDSEEILARFYNERQILANLRHPGIAQLLDGGTTEEGLPYFAMEYVEGESIDRYCERHRLSVNERLALFRKVCSAVHFAHQNLVVHRDLKPNNILVTEAGEPKLLDFGIAKLLQPELASREFATVPGRGPMTPDYASPEQILNTAITTACDVYALGVLLYRLLTGVAPYRLKNKGYAEIMNAICLAEPRRPSTAVGHEQKTVMEKRPAEEPKEPRTSAGPAEFRRLRRQLSGDLDAIVMKAMRKEPRHRYGSAIELSEDLQRYIVGHPVQARQGNWAYLSGKFVRRHKLGLAMVALILVFSVTVTFLWRQAVHGQEVAEFERRRAERISDFLEDVFISAEPDQARGTEVTVRQVLDRGREKIDEELTDAPELRADMLGILGTVYQKLGFYEPARELKEWALEARQASGSQESLELATDINNLGNLLYRMGDYPAAEGRFRASLEMRRRLKQPPAETAINMINLANALKIQGKYDPAESLLLQAQESLKGTEKEFDLAFGLYSLAALYTSKGDVESATEPFRRTLEIYSRLFGNEHTRVARVLNSLGRVYHFQGDHQKARTSYENALRIRLKLLGDEHDDVANTRKNLAALLLDTGETEAAGDLIRQALEVLRRSRQEGDWIVADAKSVWGAYLVELGRFEEAEPHLIESHEIISRARGERDLVTRNARQRVVNLYDRWGHEDRADAYRAEASSPDRESDQKR